VPSRAVTSVFERWRCPPTPGANGDIFGGRLLSQMDVGGGVFASKIANSRTVRRDGAVVT
jgi:acyl-CoA hydrolase